MSGPTDNRLKVVSLNTKEPVPEVIALLEDMLNMAKKGEIISCAAVAVTPEGNTGHHFTSDCPVYLIGEMRVLERELIDRCIDLTLHSAGDAY